MEKNHLSLTWKNGRRWTVNEWRRRRRTYPFLSLEEQRQRRIMASLTSRMGELWMNEKNEYEGGHHHSYPLQNREEKNHRKSNLRNGRRWTMNEWKKKKDRGREESWHVWPQEWEMDCAWMRKKKKKEEDITNPSPRRTMTNPYHNTMKDVNFEPPFVNSCTFKATVGNPSKLGLLGKCIHDSCNCLLTPGCFHEVVHLYIIDLEMWKK